MAVGGFVGPSVRAVVVETARRVVERVVLRLLVAVVVVGGAVACVIALPSVRGTRSRPVTVAGRWSVVAVCSADAPCSLALSRPPRQSAALFPSSESRPTKVAFGEMQ